MPATITRAQNGYIVAVHSSQCCRVVAFGLRTFEEARDYFVKWQQANGVRIDLMGGMCPYCNYGGGK